MRSPDHLAVGFDRQAGAQNAQVVTIHDFIEQLIDIRGESAISFKNSRKHLNPKTTARLYGALEALDATPGSTAQFQLLPDKSCQVQRLMPTRAKAMATRARVLPAGVHHPEQNCGQSRGPIQQSWDRFIQTAFTQARSTGTQAPGGVSHKMRLIDVLTQNGT